MTDKEKFEKLKKLADAMYYAAQYLTTDASKLHKAMDEYHKFIIHEWREEPVSDDLVDYINELSKQFPEVSFAKLSRIAVRVAKWKEKEMQSTIELVEDHAILTGMNKMEQQMMAKAIDGKVIANGMGNPILHLWDKGRHLIDKKVKVIVIKED